MRFANPFAAALLALAASFALSCSSPDNGGGNNNECTDPNGCEEGCVADEDCGDPRFFICNASGVCEKACTQSADCLTHPGFEDGPWTGCEAGLGCSCDERKCVAKSCTANSECGTGQVCKAGKCVAPDTGADECEVVPSYAIGVQGQPMKYKVLAMKAGQPVVVGSGAITHTITGANTSGDAFGNIVVTPDTTGTAELVATIGTVTCKSTLVTLPAATGGRVVVVDEQTGRLVQGAKVIWGAAEATESTTKGIFTVDAPAASATISVFHLDYGYVTLVATTSKDLYIPLRRNTDKLGGYKGTFTNFPKRIISAGFAGSSIPGSFTDLDFGTMLGATEPTVIDLVGANPIPVPASVMLGNGQKVYKADYKAQGIAGVCRAGFKGQSAAEVDAMIAAGACGTRTAWSLMGEVSVEQLLPLISEVQSSGTIEPSKVLSVLLPYLKTFKSGVARDVSFTLQSKNADGTPDYAQFTTQNLTPEMLLTHKVSVQVPKLETNIDAAIVLGGTLTPGRGMVPLGLTGGTDTMVGSGFNNADGWVIRQDGDKAPFTYSNDGKLTLRMSPAHGGVEGSRYAVVTIAIPTKGTAPNGAALTSGLVKFADSLPYDENGSKPVQFDNGFLKFTNMVAGSYDYLTGEFSSMPIVDGATVHRAVFIAESGRRWTVYYKTPGFALPKPPAGFKDRTMADETNREFAANHLRSGYVIQALRLSDGTAAVSSDQLFAFNSTNADRVAELTQAFLTYQKYVSVGFVEPKANAAGEFVAPKNQVFKVKVKGFEVADEGKVEFLVDGVSNKVVGTATNYEVSTALDLASVASGATVKVTARLVKMDGSPVVPPVESELNVKIQ